MSLNSGISETIERFIRGAIFLYLTEHFLLKYAQHVFVPKRIPITNLFSTHRDVLALLDKKTTVGMVFLIVCSRRNGSFFSFHLPGNWVAAYQSHQQMKVRVIDEFSKFCIGPLAILNLH